MFKNFRLIFSAADIPFFFFFFFQNGFTVLHICARKNQIKLVSILLERGVQADTTTRFGVSPLHLAAQEGNPEIVDMLLEHGSSPGVQTMVNLSYECYFSQDSNRCKRVLEADILPLFKGPEVLSSASDKARLFAENFLRTLILMTLLSLYMFSL